MSSSNHRNQLCHIHNFSAKQNICLCPGWSFNTILGSQLAISLNNRNNFISLWEIAQLKKLLQNRLKEYKLFISKNTSGLGVISHPIFCFSLVGLSTFPLDLQPSSGNVKCSEKLQLVSMLVHQYMRQLFSVISILH